MAKLNFQQPLLQSSEQFTCSICLDVFTNPVSIPCGHSFCSSCITSYWEGQGKSCFCPLCKESFRKRPELHINHTLKEITEQFKRMLVSGAGSNGPQCPRHGHSLELFCKTDQTCICVTCAEREHYGHSVIEAKREMNIKKVSCLFVVSSFVCYIFFVSFACSKVNAEQEKAGTVSMFAELMKAVEKSQAELLEVVEMGQRAAELRSQAFIRELQTEISEIRNRCSSLNQLTQSQDHVSFFKVSFKTRLKFLPVTKSWEEVAMTPDPTAGAVLRNVTQMVEEVQEALRRLSPLLPSSLFKCVLFLSSVDVTLDQDSAHPRLIISEDGKQVHCSDRYQVVPDTTERFDRVVCVLGRQGISSGCHYWEVVVGEKTDWDLGIASHSINRKGKIAANPANGFWFLSLRDKHEYVFRTEPSMPIVVQTKPQCVGVYVDYEKGQLSFYNADTKSLIFTFTDSFAETLYPFFSPCTNKSGKNEAPLIIYPAYPANPSWLTEK
uniref:E3 ubiquitin-protein ligase TRIM39-like n=1 Tax=Sinocyclocheilus anshuiensis TaxID=1608454 RepID=A0A671NY84_9TELE